MKEDEQAGLAHSLIGKNIRQTREELCNLKRLLSETEKNIELLD